MSNNDQWLYILLGFWEVPEEERKLVSEMLVWGISFSLFWNFWSFPNGKNIEAMLITSYFCCQPPLCANILLPTSKDCWLYFLLVTNLLCYLSLMEKTVYISIVIDVYGCVWEMCALIPLTLYSLYFSLTSEVANGLKFNYF